MMWSYYGGWNWLWMSAMMLVFWGGLMAFGIWAIRTLAGPRTSGDVALETLRRRLAAGEISEEEYDRTKQILQS